MCTSLASCRCLAPISVLWRCILDNMSCICLSIASIWLTAAFVCNCRFCLVKVPAGWKPAPVNMADAAGSSLCQFHLWQALAENDGALYLSVPVPRLADAFVSQSRLIQCRPSTLLYSDTERVWRDTPKAVTSPSATKTQNDLAGTCMHTHISSSNPGATPCSVFCYRCRV